MEYWYDHYENRHWYQATFMINLESGKRRRNNNISGSNYGSDLTCFAMILGINPAYLSALFAEKGQFYKEGGRFDDKQIDLKPYFKQTLAQSSERKTMGQRTRISRFSFKIHDDPDEAKELVHRARQNNRHVVCGWGDIDDTDSRLRVWGNNVDDCLLVAGKKDNTFFLWNPNLKLESNPNDLDNHITGSYTLESLYEAAGEKSEHVWFAVYDVEEVESEAGDA